VPAAIGGFAFDMTLFRASGAMPSRRDIIRPLAVGAWFTALALLVAGPLLGDGYLLLLDYPSGPQFPQLSAFPLPSSGDIGNTIPLLGTLALLKEVDGLLPDKLLLLAPIVIGGSGVYHAVRSQLEASFWPAIYGGTLFVVNPFVYDRYLAGHLFFLLAYSLLPWALSPLCEMTRRPSGRGAVVVGLWFFVLGAIDVHVLGIYGLLAVIAAISAPTRYRLAFGAAAIGIGTVMCAYWLLPSLFISQGEEIGAADLAVYASRPEGFAILPTLLGMDGFWRDEFTGPGERVPALYLLLVPMLALALAGVADALRSERRRFAIVLSIGAVLGLVLAAGSAFPPTADAFRWAFEHVPYMGIYREPQKFLALLILAYAIFGAVGLDAILRTRERSRRPSITPVAAAVGVAVVLGYGYTMVWGFGGQAKLSHYPASWAEADRIMTARGHGRVLVFPWHLYAVWSFSDGRIVANPAPAFFSREVLAGDEAGFRSVGLQSPDPFSRYIADLLRSRQEIRWLGHLVAPLGVRFVASLKEADWNRYEFLTRQEDLVSIYRSDRLVLFENEAWRGYVIGLDEGASIAAPSEVFGSAEERDVANRIFSSDSLVTRADGGFSALADRLPNRKRVAATEGAFVATGDRCSDGWRLGDDEPICDLGAVAAFENPRSDDAALSRPLTGVQLIGYVLSGLTLVAAAIYLLYSFRLPTRG
jgi:hypothetical protein